MAAYRRQQCGAIDSNLLWEVSAAACAFFRTRGRNRLVMAQRYLAALRHFNQVALERLPVVSISRTCRQRGR